MAAALEALPADFDWNDCLSGDSRKTDWVRCAISLAHELLGARVGRADVVRDRVRAGHSIESILGDELRRHPRFDALLGQRTELLVESTSFQPYVTSKVCGENWLMVGEAASMPDPLTGNGVTSGIRHARRACEAIRAAGTRDAFSRRQRQTYARHVFRLGHSFNAHIERAIYQPQIRWGFGLRTATYAYTFFAFFMNALHARFDPRGRLGMSLFSLLFLGARGWIAGWTLIARTALWYRGLTRRGELVRP